MIRVRLIYTVRGRSHGNGNTGTRARRLWNQTKCRLNTEPSSRDTTSNSTEEDPHDCYTRRVHADGVSTPLEQGVEMCGSIPGKLKYSGPSRPHTRYAPDTMILKQGAFVVGRLVLENDVSVKLGLVFVSEDAGRGC